MATNPFHKHKTLTLRGGEDADEPRSRLDPDRQMSLLAPRALLVRKALIKAPKVPLAIRVLRTTKVRRLARRVSVISPRTWRAGAAPEVLGLVLDPAPVRSVVCRTRLQGGSRRQDRN